MQLIENPAQELFSRLYVLHQGPDETFPPAQLVEWLDTLPYITEAERAVLRLRTSLADGYCYTLGEIAAMRGGSRERVRQIEARGLKCLRFAHARGMLARQGSAQKEPLGVHPI